MGSGKVGDSNAHLLCLLRVLARLAPARPRRRTLRLLEKSSQRKTGVRSNFEKKKRVLNVFELFHEPINALKSRLRIQRKVSDELEEFRIFFMNDRERLYWWEDPSISTFKPHSDRELVEISGVVEIQVGIVAVDFYFCCPVIKFREA